MSALFVALVHCRVADGGGSTLGHAIAYQRLVCRWILDAGTVRRTARRCPSVWHRLLLEEQRVNDAHGVQIAMNISFWAILPTPCSTWNGWRGKDCGSLNLIYCFGNPITRRPGIAIE